MSKKRLLLCYHSSEYGGIETQILDIIKGLSGEIDIFVATKKGRLFEKYLEAGAKEVIECYPTSEFDINYIRNIYKLIKLKKIDIVHAHELRTGVQVMLASKFAGCPKRIYHVHTPFIFWVYKGTKKYIALLPNWIANFITGNFLSTHVLALTPYISKIRRNREMIMSSKIVIIPNGVKNIPEIGENELINISDKYNIPNNSFVIGYTARFSEEKGHETLIRAYSKVYSKIPDSILLLLSDGENLERMRILSRDLGIDKNVIFTGRVSDDEKFALLQKMDLFVFPTKAEGFGISLLEAMMLGIPSLVSDIPVLHDLGEDAVVYFDTTDIDILNSKIIDLFNDVEGRKALAIKSKSISQKYSMELFITNYKKLYLSE